MLVRTPLGLFRSVALGLFEPLTYQARAAIAGLRNPCVTAANFAYSRTATVLRTWSLTESEYIGALRQVGLRPQAVQKLVFIFKSGLRDWLAAYGSAAQQQIDNV